MPYLCQIQILHSAFPTVHTKSWQILDTLDPGRGKKGHSFNWSVISRLNKNGSYCGKKNYKKPTSQIYFITCQTLCSPHYSVPQHSMSTYSHFVNLKAIKDLSSEGPIMPSGTCRGTSSKNLVPFWRKSCHSVQTDLPISLQSLVVS